MPRIKVVPCFSSSYPPGSAEWRREYQRARRKTAVGREGIARTNLMQLYGLSLERYDALYEQQRGVCAICGKAIVRAYGESTGKRGPKKNGVHIDHDHACCPGKKSCGRCIRGLLCSHCNHGLGSFRDKPELMRLAIEYITRPRQREPDKQPKLL
jgi:hypothetical protein